MLFIVPLIIFIVFYALALWFSARGRRLVRRFFLLPVLVSLAVTLWLAMRFGHHRLAPLPGGSVSAAPNNAIHFLPLYALRVAPLVLGVCVIVNAAARFAIAGTRRRFRRPAPPAASEGLASDS